MPLFFRGAPEPAWEVVDHQEISAVPTYYGDSDVEITSVSPQSISRTYTFDAPTISTQRSIASPATPSRPSRPSRQGRFFALLRRKSSDITPCFLRRHTIRSASPTPSSSSATDDDDARSCHSSSCRASYRSSNSSEHEFERGVMQEQQHVSVRDAVAIAREQLLMSEAMQNAGGDCFSFEGWSVTRLRKGSQHRLRVRYFGRPAKAVLQSPTSSLPKVTPPFLEMLEGVWY